MTSADEPPPAFSYEGSRFWPISAGLSFCGTTAAVLSVLAYELSPSIPLVRSEAIGLFLLLFFFAALLSGVIGGITMLFRWRSDPGRLLIRGADVSEAIVQIVLLFCYSMPWALVIYLSLRPTIVR